MEDNPVRRERSKTKKAKRLSPALLARINPNAAGVDCGSRHHHVAVPVDRDAEPVRRFTTLTPDLHRMADWLAACGIETVAMEATGVYWIPLYEILEERGFEVVLVNARHVRNVPGRKTDVVDCQWIQELHSLGLLRGSFRPSAEIASLRAYLRHREKLVLDAASHIRRMQKALVLMNVQLHNVITDITGKTGMQILRDIARSVTDPKALASHRDYRCRASEEEIAASLTGNYRPEHVFVLRQNLELYDSYQRQIQTCDGEIDSLLQNLAAKQGSPGAALPPARRRYRLQKNDQKHFTSWLTLAPKNKITGGRLISSRTQPSANRAAAMLRMSAMSVGKTSTALGAYYRRIAYRIGKAKAITATARKLAVLVYRVLRGDIDYCDPGAEAYEAHHRTRTLRNLRNRAQRLGLGLIDLETGEVLERGVS
jgi:transposase